MNRKSLKRQSIHKIGCGYLLAQAVLICLLLITNGFLVTYFVNMDWGEEVRIGQAIQMVLPIAMVFGEFWLFDFMFARTTRNKT